MIIPYVIKSKLDFIRHDIPAFFRNAWQFRKELAYWRSFDCTYSMDLFAKGIEISANMTEKYGMESDVPRLKKVKAMRRAVELLKMHSDTEFIDEAERQLGVEMKFSYDDSNPKFIDLFKDLSEEDHEVNRKIMELSSKIEKETWDELWNIIKGQDYDVWNYQMKDSEKSNEKFDEWFDGTGIKGWWD